MEEKLGFAYKYPFSEEAKEIIKALPSQGFEEKYALSALERINEDLGKKPEFVPTSYSPLMLSRVVSYVYARLIVSATQNNYVVKMFAKGEAERSAKALTLSPEDIPHLAKELSVELEASGDSYFMGVFSFLKIAKGAEGLKLYSMPLKSGNVVLNKEQAILLLKSAMEDAILQGLPIPKDKLPQEVFGYVKGVAISEKPLITNAKASGKYAWIEKLLQTPIPDVRHRSVNLILAPYLVNVKGLSEEEAANIIIGYIEKCKLLNPNTKVTDSYIRYQCKYAKEHGLRPLSLERAKELFKGILDLSEFS